MPHQDEVEEFEKKFDYESLIKEALANIEVKIINAEENKEELAELVKETEDNKEPDEDKMSLIGQFGVGFYSCFMVADEITVISKAAGSEKAYKWISSGALGIFP